MDTHLEQDEQTRHIFLCMKNSGSERTGRCRAGGEFDFDAVCEDHSIVATISTSESRTSGGKNAVGKRNKLEGQIDDDMEMLGLRPHRNDRGAA